MITTPHASHDLVVRSERADISADSLPVTRCQRAVARGAPVPVYLAYGKRGIINL